MKFCAPKNNSMSSGSLIQDIRYDNIPMEYPKQWGILMGSTQQL